VAAHECSSATTLEVSTAVHVPGAAFVHCPPRVSSLARACGRLAVALGRPLDPEQYAAIDVLTGVREDGRPSALIACVICPRQNMKTWIMMLIVLARLLEPGGDRLIIWSAHMFDTAQETFRDFLYLIAEHDWLDKLVERIDRANGDEAITFRGGRRLKFRARAKTGGRGLTGDCIVLDEGFALQAAHMGALIPILSTRPRALVLVGSSAGMEGSEILRGFRDSGREGGPDAPAYVEFCAPGSFQNPGCESKRCQHFPGTQGCVLDREDYVLMANPAARIGRISMDYLRKERIALRATPFEYARERFGWWEDPVDSLKPIPLDRWSQRTDPLSRIAAGSPRVLSFDISPGRSSGAIAGAGWRDDGDMHMSLIEHRPGTSWIVPRLLELIAEHRPAAVVVDGASPAATEIFDLLEAKIKVRSEANPRGQLVIIGFRDVGRVCGTVYDGIAGDAPTMWHADEPILADALDGAARRTIGDGSWGLARAKSETDICPLVAVFQAAWGLSTSPKRVASLVF
jgi:hypothetical protein